MEEKWKNWKNRRERETYWGDVENLKKEGKGGGRGEERKRKKKWRKKGFLGF